MRTRFDLKLALLLFLLKEVKPVHLSQNDKTLNFDDLFPLLTTTFSLSQNIFKISVATLFRAHTIRSDCGKILALKWAAYVGVIKFRHWANSSCRKGYWNFAMKTWMRGTLGGTQYRNAVRKIGKYRNFVSKIEIPIPHLWSITLTLTLYPSRVFF